MNATGKEPPAAIVTGASSGIGFRQEIFTSELTRGLRSGGMADRIIA